MAMTMWNVAIASTWHRLIKVDGNARSDMFLRVVLMDVVAIGKKLRECMPVIVMLMQPQIKVDGNVRSDMFFPPGFMEVVAMVKTKEKHNEFGVVTKLAACLRSSNAVTLAAAYQDIGEFATNSVN